MMTLAPTALILLSLLRSGLVSGYGYSSGGRGLRSTSWWPSPSAPKWTTTTTTRRGLPASACRRRALASPGSSSPTPSLRSRAENDRRSESEASGGGGGGRRGALLFLGALALLTAQAAAAPAAGAAEVRGTAVTPFNSLAFQYRGGEFGGLRAEDVGEPSISYAEFSERLRRGGVAYVEFSAPFGDVARATIRRGGDGTATLRIGEGYPIEKHDGYSSPAFAIRAVQNAGVPYKFVVPGLDRYSSSGK
jgi:hypothetical protein